MNLQYKKKGKNKSQRQNKKMNEKNLLQTEKVKNKKINVHRTCQYFYS